MRVSAINQSQSGILWVNSSEIKSKSNLRHVLHAPGLSYISFTGGELNLNQVLSITFENNGLGLPEAAQGGA